MMKIYHNPRCSKSREALQILNDLGAKVDVINYLEQIPSREELADLLSKLNLKAEDIVRKNETVFKEKFKGRRCTEKEWIEILHNNPKLIQRPIVVNGKKAVVGRPPEIVKSIL